MLHINEPVQLYILNVDNKEADKTQTQTRQLNHFNKICGENAFPAIYLTCPPVTEEPEMKTN
jgi:hypothetical protein